MSLLKNCDECNMTCCPNYDPDSIKGLGEKMAKECMEKIRKNVEKEFNPSFIEEMKELYERYDLKDEKVE